MKWLKRSLWALLTLLLLLAGVTLWLLGTASGTRALLALSARALPPEQLSIAEAEGALSGPLQLRGLVYAADGLELRIDRARLDWRPGRLLGGELLVEELSASGVKVTLPPPAEAEPEPPAEPFALNDIALPLGFEVEKLLLTDVEITPYGADAPLRVERLALSARSVDGRLQIGQLSLQLSSPAEVSAELAGAITPLGDYPLEFDLSWRYRDPQLGLLRGDGRVEGALGDSLVLRHRVDGAVQADLQARAQALFAEPSWRAELTLTGAEIGRLEPGLENIGLRGSLRSQGRLDDFTADGVFGATLPELGPVEARLLLRGSSRSFRLEELTLDSATTALHFALSAEADLDTQTLRASGRWRDLAWPPIGSAQFSSPAGELELDGTLEDYRLDMRARVGGELSGDLDLALAARGSTRAIRLQQLRVDAPDRELQLELDGRLRFADLSGELNGRWRELGWPLRGQPQYRSPNGTLQASGSAADYRARIDAELDGELLKPLRAALRLRGDRERARLESLSLSATQGDDPTRLSARGELYFEDLRFDASGDWQELRWPLNPDAEAEYASPSGEFEASGSLRDYRFELDASVGGAALPSGRWQLQGEGGAERLRGFELVADTLGGRLQARGEAAWQPQPSWRLTLAGSGLEPGEHWPEWPGKIGFTLFSEGRLQLPPAPQPGVYFDRIIDSKAGPLQGISTELRLRELEGELRGQALDGEIALALDDGAVRIDTLRLQAGAAALSAGGGIDRQMNMDLNWQLQVPALADLLPQAAGAVSSRGELRGEPLKPRADVVIAADALVFQELRLQQLRAEARIDAGGAAVSTLQIEADGLEAGGQRVESLKLDGDGTPGEHRLRLRLDSEPADLVLALAGGVDEHGRWQGRLTELQAADTPAGSWRLREPVALAASPEDAELERLCLFSRPAELCLQGRWSAADGGRARLEVSALDLGRFTPPGIALDSRLAGAADATLAADGDLVAEVDLNLNRGRLRLQRDGETIDVNIAGGGLKAVADGEDLNAGLQLDLGRLGRLDGEFSIEDLNGAGRVEGAVTAGIEDLAIVSRLVPPLQEVRGRLAADLKLAGTLPLPTIQGEVALREAALQVPEAGIAIEQLGLVVNASGSGPLTVSGQARSGGGRIELGGEIDPFVPSAQLRISGESFQAVDAFNLKALVSPDLRIRFADGRLDVGGELGIPEAELGAPEGMTSAVGSSGDVVIVEDGEPQSQTGIEIHADLRVILGDRVFVRVAGFDGQLAGDLRIEQTPQLAPRGTGNVEVVAGDYQIYGQDLTIERGRVLFSGGPIANPGLDLKVARSFDDVTVGAQVSGTLRNPQLALFSEPAMPDSSILSYIVFGKPASENSLSESALLSKAVSAIGNSGAVGGKISKGLGLDTLEFDGADPNEASVTVGKYLSPRLYVSYGIGLFDALNTFSLRYKINDRLRFESSSNADKSSADLLYSVER